MCIYYGKYCSVGALLVIQEPQLRPRTDGLIADVHG